MRLPGSSIVALGLVVGLVGIAPAADRDRDRDRGQADRSASLKGSAALAARVDARLAAAWAAGKVHPVARAADGEFLRRASLDLVGKIPSASAARDFLDDPNPAKRGALVDRLLDSPAYAARAALIWRQLLLPDAASPDQQLTPGGLEAWLARKVREEAGYDRVVREILAAKLSGRTADAMGDASFEPSPAAFYAAKLGKPEVLAADSARAFLGVRLECAQCHNHPFAKWKRGGILGLRRLLRRRPSDRRPQRP